MSNFLPKYLNLTVVPTLSNFMQSSAQETRYVIAVNTIAPIELTKKLTKNLVKSDNPRAMFIGSLSGLDNAASSEVANTASKFGLRGVAQALNIALHDYKIGYNFFD